MDLEQLRKNVELEIRAMLSGGSTPLFGLSLMNHYHLGFSDREGHFIDGSKGKYLRPIFCMAVCGGLAGDIGKSVSAAASLELIHRTTLVFDDIQDQGKERNGQPAMWTIWGEYQAINAGLAMSCLARLAAQRSHHRGVDAETTLRTLFVLENAVLDLCWGQYYDLSFMETLDLTVGDYLRMVQGKTAALFGAACEVGALVAGVNDERVLAARNLGLALGIAFQIHDDYLGVWGDEAEVGKTANDIIEKKRSLPVILALYRRQGQMKGWLRLPSIGPDLARNIKAWMEREGIDEEVKNKEGYYLREARQDLEQLGLAEEWAGHFQDLISFLGERKV
jgi:geranylgeranyl diphosphate synthase type I